MSDRRLTTEAGTAREVLVAFLKLGLTSFGGPIAHLAYFRREFVEQRKWVGEKQFAQLLALCQFLPGPASSQLGFSLGLLRAGWPGAFAAFAAFTLPSAILLFGFAVLLPSLAGGAGEAALHGLKLVAVAVVAQGVLGMARQLCPDAPRASIAASSAALILASPNAWMQIAVVVLGAAAGLVICRSVQPVAGDAPNPHYGARLGWVLLAAFAVLLLGLPLAARAGDGLFAVVEAFYRAGALVFGGGHVVLPLLRETVVAPGWIADDDFLAGYGAAQAVPGPMFTLAAYLGARLPGEAGGLAGAATALAAIFLPGFLLVAGALPLWRAMAGRPSAARAIAGVNAAVVGLLGAALYDPVWTSAVRGPLDVAIALVGFTLLVAWRASALLVVLVIVLLSAASPAAAEEPIRIVERRDLFIGQAGAGVSYHLDLSVHQFRGGRWSKADIAAAVAQAAALLRQCGVKVARAELRVVQAPPRFRVYFTPLSRELLARLAAPKPAVFFVDDTRNDPAFDAEAIGRANAASRPELADTVWVAYGARDLPQALAHELVHLLSDSGAHSDAPGNLMRPETTPGNTRLAPAQCARLRAKGAANGLLRVN